MVHATARKDLVDENIAHVFEEARKSEKGDALADDVILQLYPTYEDLCNFAQDGLIDPKSSLLDVVLEKASTEGPTSGGPFGKYVESLCRTPAWVDWSSILRGQEVFVKHAHAGSMALLHASLIASLASPATNAVLLSADSRTWTQAPCTYQRMFETFYLVAAATEAPGALAPPSARPAGGAGAEAEAGAGGRGGGGAAWRACGQVRLLHGAARALVAARRRRGGGGGGGSPGLAARNNIEKHEGKGTPINQWDMANTLITFSTIFIKALSNLKIHFSDEEKDDFIHLWRYIGFLIGIEDRYNPCINYEISQHWMNHCFLSTKPNGLSSRLAHHVLKSIENKFPVYFPLDVHLYIARRMLGDQLADGFNIKKASRIHLVLLLKAKVIILGLKIFSWLGSTSLKRMKAHNHGFLRFMQGVTLKGETPRFSGFIGTSRIAKQEVIDKQGEALLKKDRYKQIEHRMFKTMNAFWFVLTFFSVCLCLMHFVLVAYFVAAACTTNFDGDSGSDMLQPTSSSMAFHGTTPLHHAYSAFGLLHNMLFFFCSFFVIVGDVFLVTVISS